MFRENRWVDLPSDILELIMKRLFYADLLNLSAVCKPWNSLFNKGGGGGGTVVPLKQSPWLVMFDRIAASTTSSALYNDALCRNPRVTCDIPSTSCSCKLFDPVYKKTYIIDIDTNNNIGINLFLFRRVHASKHGWLLLESSERFRLGFGYKLLFAYTPFSSVNNFIELPIMHYLDYVVHVILGTFTSNPSIMDDQNCLFIILHDPNYRTGRISRYMHISSYRRGEQSWCNRYLEYPDWFEPINYSCRARDVGRWIYSEGNIYYIGVGRWMKFETIQILKWELKQSRHGDEHDVLYCSVVMNKKLDEVDDDDDDLLSKLGKEHFTEEKFSHPYTSTAGTEYESCHSEKSRLMVKIDPPS